MNTRRTLLTALTAVTLSLPAPAVAGVSTGSTSGFLGVSTGSTSGFLGVSTGSTTLDRPTNGDGPTAGDPSNAGDRSTSASRRVVSHPAATTARERARARTFWTPARMRRAVSPESRLTGATPAAAGSTLAARTRFLGGPWRDGGRVRRTTGKVFFEHRGDLYVCSAAVVSGVSADLVVTAGHCVYDEGRWASSWVFVPAYRNGRQPYGAWTARRLATTRQWRDRGSRTGNFNQDVGFAVLNRRNRRHIAHRVGAQGIIFNRDRGKVYRAFGYPATSPYNGERLVYCRGRGRPDRYDPSSTAQGIACNMTPGASGGPWLIRFDRDTGRGLVNSVTSYLYRGVPRVFGPYFGRPVQRLYASLQPTARDGSYLRVQEDGRIFRVVDGSLKRIRSWRSVGGVKKHYDVTAIYLRRFR